MPRSRGCCLSAPAHPPVSSCARFAALPGWRERHEPFSHHPSCIDQRGSARARRMRARPGRRLEWGRQRRNHRLRDHLRGELEHGCDRSTARPLPDVVDRPRRYQERGHRVHPAHGVRLDLLRLRGQLRELACSVVCVRHVCGQPHVVRSHASSILWRRRCRHRHAVARSAVRHPCWNVEVRRVHQHELLPRAARVRREPVLQRARELRCDVRNECRLPSALLQHAFGRHGGSQLARRLRRDGVRRGM